MYAIGDSLCVLQWRDRKIFPGAWMQLFQAPFAFLREQVGGSLLYY
jgi:hypothetical protein